MNSRCMQPLIAFFGLLLHQYMQLLAPTHLTSHQLCGRSVMQVIRTCMPPDAAPNTGPWAFLILYFIEAAASQDTAIFLFLKSSV